MLKLVVLSISFVLLSATAMSGILPQIRDDLGITQTQSELLVTVPSIATLIFVALCDVIISKVGLKKTVIIGLLVSGIGGIMPLLNNISYTYFLLSRFMLGAGKGLIFTPSVSYINILFDEKERTTLIGYRSAAEMLGQALLTLIVGGLAFFSWNFSFITNSVFFVIAGFVTWKIPEVGANSNTHERKEGRDEKIPLIVFPLALFVSIIAISSSMIGIRFPALATEIMGDGYNSSIWIAAKPIFGILAATFFGKLNAMLGKKLLYLGMLFLITSQFMIGFSNGNFVILVVGFLMSSVVLGWVGPIIINIISNLTTGKQQRLSTACVLICVNIGMFAMPFIVQGLETIVRSTELTAPYPIAGAFVLALLVSVVISSNNKSFRVKVGLKDG